MMTSKNPRLYFAGSLRCAESIHAIARGVALLTDAEVTSRWHGVVAALPPTERRDPTDREERRRILAENLLDLDDATMMVVIADRGRPNATLCEVGYAYAREKPIVWVHDGGDGTNIFDAADGVTLIDSAFLEDEDLVAVIAGQVVEAATQDRVAS